MVNFFKKLTPAAICALGNASFQIKSYYGAYVFPSILIIITNPHQPLKLMMSLKFIMNNRWEDVRLYDG